jgi:hypothetical protein
MKNLQAFIIGLFTILIVGAATANAASWTVTKSTNSNDGVCAADCSLREAVAAADSGDTVVFSGNLVGQTITLGGSEIVITKRITIDGNLDGVNVAFISGEMMSRIFLIETGGGLDLRNATLVQGNGASANINSGYGGAIYARTNTAISLDRVSIRGNQTQYGGAVYIDNSGTHRITNSSLTGNSAEQGTAILGFNTTIFMSNTTVSGNYLSLDEPQTVGGGAITTRRSTVTIRNSTIVNNSAKRGGGICVINTGYPTPENKYNISNTIVAGNTATIIGQDIHYTSPQDFELISAGGNLIQNLETVPAGIFTQPKDISGVNPLLGPINANNGGFPVATHSLQAGSPARNGGLNENAVDSLTNQPLTTDARGAGFPRIADTTVDIGAFEDQSGNTSLVVTKKTNSNDLVCDTDCSLREAVHQASLNFGTDTITFAPNVFGTLALGGSYIEIKNQNVNIVGYPNLSAETLIVSGGNTNNIFYIHNATVNISGMTLANGNSGGYGGAIQTGSNSHLWLDKVILRNNFSEAAGAIFLSEGATGRITNSTISSNSANVVSGIWVTGNATLDMANTTVSGGIDVDGISGRGAVFVTGTAKIRNSTIAYNRTSGGAGAGISVIGGNLNIGNTIVSNNIATSSPDMDYFSGAITSVGGNLIGNPQGFPAGTFNQTNDQTGVDPLLGLLADNGGNVPTHSLLPGSPAINTSINGNAVDPFNNSVLTNDARGAGFARINGTTVDKGAFESSIAPTAASVTIGGRVTVQGRGLRNALVTLTDQNGNTRMAMTSSFGYYRFADVQVGGTYVINVVSKRFQFDPRILTLAEETNDLNFVENSNSK